MIQYYYVLALKARTDYMFCAGFFHTRKNLKNFSKEVIKSHLAVLIWCGKRDKHFSNHKGKEVRLMKPSDFQKTVQCRFESCLKKVVRSVVKDYYKELNRTMRTYHYSVRIGRGKTTFPTVALGSLRGSLAFF